MRYGCSLGGSFEGLLVQRGNAHIDHVILGSSDLDQDSGLSAKFKAWRIGKILHGMFQKGKLPGFMQKRLKKKPNDEIVYYEKMIDVFGMNNTRMALVRRESIRNQFYSDLVTPIENNIATPGTTIHSFFAAKMGKEYLRRYRQHFQDPDIRRYEMQHEELLICYLERWAEEIRNRCTEWRSQQNGEKQETICQADSPNPSGAGAPVRRG